MALEDRLGRKLDINHNFYPWDKEFPTDARALGPRARPASP